MHPFSLLKHNHSADRAFNWDLPGLKRPAIYLAAAAMLVLFGGVLLPLLGHIVIICLEVMELLLENFLEAVFGLELHDAQMVTAWTGFIVFTVLLIELGKRVARSVEDAKSKLVARVADKTHR